MMKIIGNTVGTTRKRAIPQVTPEAEGKVLKVVGGELTYGDNLPSCSPSNEGQFLMVVGGVPTWATVPDAEGGSF